MLTDSSPGIRQCISPPLRESGKPRIASSDAISLFRAAATSSFEKIFLFSVIALSSLLYPYFFYWYLHTACVTVAHAIFQPNIPPGPWRDVFLFCRCHICGSKSFSAWPSARCFCSSSRLRFLSRYIQRGRMCGADVSNIRHRLPITPSARPLD